MDWEKQDNELRKLMQESGDFLPDDELWDQAESWNNLKQKMNPVGKMISFRMLRYAAAACFICAVSFFLIKYSSRPNTQPMQVKASKQMVVPVENVNTQTTDLGGIAIKDEGNIDDNNNNVNIEDNAIATSTGGKENKYPKTIMEKSMDMPNDLGQVRKRSEELLTQNMEASNPESLVVKVVPEVELKKPVEEGKKDVVATKKAMRVVHYNHLNQSNTISPPGFTKQNKVDETWPAIALQNQAFYNPKDNPLSIKIELTPQTKKSL